MNLGMPGRRKCAVSVTETPGIVVWAAVLFVIQCAVPWACGDHGGGPALDRPLRPAPRSVQRGVTGCPALSEA